MTDVLLWLFEMSPALVVLKMTSVGTVTSFSRPIPRLEKLTYLELNSVHISHRALRCIFYNTAKHHPNLPNLTSLTLTNLRLTGHQKCKWLMPLVVPCLTFLTITWCTDLTVDLVRKGCSAKTVSLGCVCASGCLGRGYSF